MIVKDIAKKILTITGKETVQEAAKIMADEGMGCLVVEKDGLVEGIITERDILKQVAKGDHNFTQLVSVVMSTDILTIEQDAHIDTAANLLKEKNIKRLPVLDDGKLVGIISATDIIANAEDFNEDSFF